MSIRYNVFFIFLLIHFLISLFSNYLKDHFALIVTLFLTSLYRPHCLVQPHWRWCGANSTTGHRRSRRVSTVTSHEVAREVRGRPQAACVGEHRVSLVEPHVGELRDRLVRGAAANSTTIQQAIGVRGEARSTSTTEVAAESSSHEKII